MTSILQALQQIEKRRGSVAPPADSAVVEEKPKSAGHSESAVSHKGEATETESPGKPADGSPLEAERQAGGLVLPPGAAPAGDGTDTPDSAEPGPQGPNDRERGRPRDKRQVILPGEPVLANTGQHSPPPVERAALGHLCALEPTRTPFMPQIPQADKYRQVARSILDRLALETGTILLLELGATEGENELSLAWLAAAMAETTNKRLLLVDDRRCRQVAANLGCWNAGEVSDEACGTASWHNAVFRTGYRNLWLLESAAVEKRGGKALPDLELLLAQLRTRFQWIVWASRFADPQWLTSAAAWFDVAYLVVPLGNITGRQLRRAAEALRSSHVPLVGCLAAEG